MSYSLEVVRDNLSQTRTVDLANPADINLNPGEAILKVDRFAITANNITYGVAGDIIGYWQFFPADGEWGRIPVWGTGTVVRAGDTHLTEGSEYYGYFPMSSYLVVKPENVSDRGFTDAAEHRAPLPPTYNQYSLMTAENGFNRDQDQHRMVYFPLFATGFILDDWLFDNDYFGADDIIISSASSKTSFSLAFLLSQRKTKKVIGLTSSGNREFVEGMGIYDEVVTYDNPSALDNTRKAAFVDMAGNRAVLSAIHHHFADNLVCSAGVGITHYDARDGEDPSTLPGATPSMFFAPTQMQKRNQEWGPAKYQEEMNKAWNSFMDVVDNWVTIHEGQGPDAMVATYQKVLNGAPPSEAYVVAV